MWEKAEIKLVGVLYGMGRKVLLVITSLLFGKGLKIYPKQFSETITDFIMKRGLTFKKLAKKIGMTEDLIMRLQGQDEDFAKKYLAKDFKLSLKQ